MLGGLDIFTLVIVLLAVLTPSSPQWHFIPPMATISEMHWPQLRGGWVLPCIAWRREIWTSRLRQVCTGPRANSRAP